MYGDILRSVPKKDLVFIILPFVLAAAYLYDKYYRTYTFTKPESDCERALQCYVNDLPSTFFWNCVTVVILIYSFARQQKLSHTFDTRAKGMCLLLIILTVLYHIIFSQIREMYNSSTHVTNQDELNFIEKAQTHITIIDMLNSALPFVTGGLIGYWGTKIEA